MSVYTRFANIHIVNRFTKIYCDSRGLMGWWVTFIVLRGRAWATWEMEGTVPESALTPDTACKFGSFPDRSEA